MADNQTRSTMKNVILTHKELQLNLFWAVSKGMMLVPVKENYHIIPEVHPDYFQWRMVYATKKEGCAVHGDNVFFHRISKGDYQMNDIRPGVTVDHIRQQGEKFINEFLQYIMSQPEPVNG